MAAEVVEALDRGADAPPTFGALDVDLLRHYVINRQGKDFVLYDGLVAGLHAVSRGFFVLDTRVEQLPSAANGQTAVCSAQARILDPDQPEVTLRAASGLADASPENVSKMMQTALLRMAETRAKARALRDLLGVKMVSLEEVGPDGPDAQPERQAEGPSTSYTPRSPSFPAPVARAASETYTVDGRPFTRPQIVGIYRQRVQEAQRAGLQLAPAGTQGAPPAEDAPLPMIVAFSLELKRRLEARAGAARASAK